MILKVERMDDKGTAEEHFFSDIDHVECTYGRYKLSVSGEDCQIISERSNGESAYLPSNANILLDKNKGYGGEDVSLHCLEIQKRPRNVGGDVEEFWILFDGRAFLMNDQGDTIDSFT